MIKSIDIRNFQSHRKTLLELHPGVNAIVGISNHGKTAILRALYWAIQNRPGGTDFISHWNITEKDELLGPTSVGMTFVGPEGEYTVIRERSPADRKEKKEAFNGYRLSDGREFEAIRTDIPPDIANLLNMSPVNIARQMDMPFLISESSGEVARFINRVIHLDIIDAVLSAAEVRRRRIRTDIERNRAAIETTEKQEKAMGWVDDALILLRKAERVEERIQNMKAAVAALEQDLADHERAARVVESLRPILRAEPLLAHAQEARDQIRERRAAAADLQDQLTSHGAAMQTIARALPFIDAEPLWNQARTLGPTLIGMTLKNGALYDTILDHQNYKRNVQALDAVDLGACQGLVNEALKITDNLARAVIRISGLRQKILDYEDMKQTIEEAEAERIAALAMLPSTCPTCGKPWEEGHEIH